MESFNRLLRACSRVLKNFSSVLYRILGSSFSVIAVARSPVFVFVPGAWHGPECFDPTIQVLNRKGFTSHGIRLKSCGGRPPVLDIDSDVELIRDIIENIVSAGKDVVLVMHSYGGVPGSEAMKYLIDSNDGKNGRGRIVRMAWICAFVLPKGGSLMKALGGKDLPWFIVDGDEVNPRDPGEVFYNDLEERDAKKWIKALKPHAYRTFSSEVSVEPWLTIPSAYLLCEKDNAIPLHAQEGMISMAQAKSPNAFDFVERCGASHSPFLSIPATVGEFLIRAAGIEI